MHLLFGPRATAFSGLFAGKCYTDRLVVHAVDAGQWCHRGPCRLQRIGLTVSPPLIYSSFSCGLSCGRISRINPPFRLSPSSRKYFDTSSHGYALRRSPEA